RAAWVPPCCTTVTLCLSVRRLQVPDHGKRIQTPQRRDGDPCAGHRHPGRAALHAAVRRAAFRRPETLYGTATARAPGLHRDGLRLLPFAAAAQPVAGAGLPAWLGPRAGRGRLL